MKTILSSLVFFGAILFSFLTNIATANEVNSPIKLTERQMDMVVAGWSHGGWSFDVDAPTSASSRSKIGGSYSNRSRGTVPTKYWRWKGGGFVAPSAAPAARAVPAPRATRAWR